MANIKEETLGMRTIVPESEYYAITLTASADGTILYDVFSHFEDWADEKRTREVRAPSLVRPEQVVKHWRQIDEFYLVVNNEMQLLIFLQLGGHAVINKAVADEHMVECLLPDESIRSGALGFRSLSAIAKNEFNRAPTRKQRMRIIKRDGLACRICGRRPADHTDVELHVHHIRPWAKGGLTEDENLITLCQTCHAGLDPHDDPTLFWLLNDGRASMQGGADQRKFDDAVQHYRSFIKKLANGGT